MTDRSILIICKVFGFNKIASIIVNLMNFVCIAKKMQAIMLMFERNNSRPTTFEVIYFNLLTVYHVTVMKLHMHLNINLM